MADRFQRAGTRSPAPYHAGTRNVPPQNSGNRNARTQDAPPQSAELRNVQPQSTESRNAPPQNAGTQSAGNHSHAPYNFVPFSDILILPADSLDALTEAAGHDRIRTDRLTGELHVTLTADAPVFVSDGQPKEEAGQKNVLHFFRDARGRYCIPGSTVRGFLRQNMKILGFGLVRPKEDVEDQRLYFRDMASSGKSVNATLKKYYNNALGVKPYTAPSGKPYSIPENVHSGWLEKRNGKYTIYPTAEPYRRVSRTDVRHLHKPEERELFTKNIPVAYRLDGERVAEIQRWSKRRPGMKEGTLLCTGRWIRRRRNEPDHPNHLYLFPNEILEEEPVEVPEEDWIAYQADYEDRKNGLKQSTQRDRYDENFWALPKEGERKPVFYLRHEGHLYFGMSLYLRIGYLHSTADGLPEEQRRAAEAGALDYTDTLLGFARDKTARASARDTIAYASRVSVGDFPAEGQPAELPTVSMVLGNPKPSWYPGYLVNKDGAPQNGVNYNNQSNGAADFRLRGHKQYWLKPVEKTASGSNDNVATHIHPLPKGTVFHGVVRFENLTEEELGLLIWCLRLKRDSDEKETYYQSVGMGKPYGYGRMACTVDRALVFDTAAMYRPEGLFQKPKELNAGTINGYVAKYDHAAAGQLPPQEGVKKPSLLDRREIKDFLYMKRTVQPGGKKFSYMLLKNEQRKNEYQNVETSLPTVEELRGEAEKQTQTAPPEDSLNDMQALLKQFKKTVEQKKVK